MPSFISNALYHLAGFGTPGKVRMIPKLIVIPGGVLSGLGIPNAMTIDVLAAVTLAATGDQTAGLLTLVFLIVEKAALRAEAIGAVLMFINALPTGSVTVDIASPYSLAILSAV